MPFSRRSVLAGLSATPVIGLTGASAQSAPLLYAPPEEDPHKRTFMIWPVSRKVYRDPVFLDLVQDTIAEIASKIARFEPVTLCADISQHAAIRARTGTNVELWDIPTEDLWARDAGPLFAKTPDGGIVVSHIQFNGWGRKQVHNRDAAVAGEIARRLNLAVVPSGVTGEAGGLNHDGKGLLIAHASSWVNENRNPGLAQAEIGDRLLAAYGADRVI